MILDLQRWLGLFVAAILAPHAWLGGSSVALAVFFVPVTFIWLSARGSVSRPIHPAVAAIAGLIADSVSGGPIGHWTLIYSATACLAPMVGDWVGRVRIAGLAMLVAVAGALSVAAAAVHSVGLLYVWSDTVAAVTAAGILLGMTVVVSAAAAVTNRFVGRKPRRLGAI